MSKGLKVPRMAGNPQRQEGAREGSSHGLQRGPSPANTAISDR